MGAYFNRDRALEPEMLKGLFETELNACLAKLIAEFHDPANQPDALVARFRTYASAYDIAQRPGDGRELTESQRQKLAEVGHDEMAIEWVACDLDRHSPKHIDWRRTTWTTTCRLRSTRKKLSWRSEGRTASRCRSSPRSFLLLHLLQREPTWLAAEPPLSRSRSALSSTTIRSGSVP